MGRDEGGGSAPLDRPILELLRERLRTTRQVEDARITDESGHPALLVELSPAHYPGSGTTATMTIRWYTNDDFNVHYRETRPGADWECRWDRHPNPHNDREHLHPPPDAGTPGEDESWPDDPREMIRLVLEEVELRIGRLWE
jgi:hypothetical protein